MARVKYPDMLRDQPNRGNTHVRKMEKLRFECSYNLHTWVCTYLVELHGIPFIDDTNSVIIATSNEDIEQFRQRRFKLSPDGWLQIRLQNNRRVLLVHPQEYGLAPYATGLWNPTNYIESLD